MSDPRTLYFSKIDPERSLSYRNLRHERVKSKHLENTKCCFYYFPSNRKLNPYSTNVPLPYSLKTWENLQFSDVFRGYRSGTLVQNGLIMDCIIQVIILFMLIFILHPMIKVIIYGEKVFQNQKIAQFYVLTFANDLLQLISRKTIFRDQQEKRISRGIIFRD